VKKNKLDFEKLEKVFLRLTQKKDIM